jgi:hypothetical protein
VAVLGVVVFGVGGVCVRHTARLGRPCVSRIHSCQ